MVTSLSITEASIEIEQLEHVFSIQYLVQFKGHLIVQALLDSNSKVNAMTPAYVAVLRLRVCPTDIGAQKINRSTLSIHSIVLAIFKLKNKQEKMRFF